MQVVEKFVSINGEGLRAGELAVFIRFKGCNLNCSYCDTSWANEIDCGYEELSPEEILDYIKSTNIRNVTLTGGEPLLWHDIKRLTELILSDGSLRVEIETNGSVDISGLMKDDLTFTMDYKLPSSGCEDKMNRDNFDCLRKTDTVKFVSGSKDDLNRALQVIREYDLINRCHVYFSPVFGRIEPREIVEFMIDNNLNDARIQIQMHKVIWNPNQKGV